MLGLIQAQEEELCNIAFPMCICRLTLAWISSEISTKLLGMPTHLDRSSFTALGPISCQLVSLLSGVDWPLASPFANCLLLSSFVQLLSRSLTHFRSRRDRGLRPLFGFAPKQTKGSSAWRTTYVVLQGNWDTNCRWRTWNGPQQPGKETGETEYERKDRN